MKGLKYQLKSVLKDKFCLMTFLLPIVVAVALNFMGSIDLSSLGEHHFGVLENDLSSETIAWLERYGPVTVYKTQEELTVAINEPSTNIIGVKADGVSIKTVIAGDELDIFRQAAVTLPALYDGVAFVNKILPMTPSQYILQKVVVGFLFGSLSSIVTAYICFRLSWRDVGIMLVLILLSSFVAALGIV